MTWHGAFLMIPINIGQFQIKYRSVAVELLVRNFPSLVKSVFGWSVGYLLVGWLLRGRMSHLTPPHYSNTQLQLSCSSVQLQIIMLSSFNYSGVTLNLVLGFWVFSHCINRSFFSSIRVELLWQSYSVEIVSGFALNF